MNATAIVCSPPFAEAQSGGGISKAMNGKGTYKMTCSKPGNLYQPDEQGRTEGNLANMAETTTFWEAAREIVAESYAILRPGGISCWVVKAFVRKKAVVDFPSEWCRLLEQCGFVVVKRVRAMLTKETVEQDLFSDEPIVTKTKRASFFRRLYEAKYPHNAIDFEEVVYARKPECSSDPETICSGVAEADCGFGESTAGIVTSPPYAESLHENESAEADLDRMAKKGLTKTIAKHGKNSSCGNKGYVGQSPAAVVTSPPYAESLRGDNSEQETAAESQAKRRTPGGSTGQSCRHAGYGSDGNLGNLPAGAAPDGIVTSPPYISGGHHNDVMGAWNTNGGGHGVTKEQAGYGSTDSQLGQMNEGKPPEPATASIPIEVWTGCYDDSWDGLIVDEAFAHPAKMARGLVRRIFDDLFSSGWLKRGDTVVDPFGGIGTTSIEGASRGLYCFSCELEERFHKLAERNFKLHQRTWDLSGDPLPVMVNGDSRKLRQMLVGVMGAIVTSPPYAEVIVNPPKDGATNGSQVRRNGCASSKGVKAVRYGETGGQLGAMKAGESP